MHGYCLLGLIGGGGGGGGGISNKGGGGGGVSNKGGYLISIAY